MKTGMRMMLIGLGLISSVAMADGVLVVAPGSAISSVDSSVAARLFLGRASDVDGVAVTPVNQNEDSPVRTEFENEVLGKTGARLRSYWSRLVFTGKAKPIEEKGGDAEVKAFVSSNDGAVGYISAASVDDSVKVIFEF